MSGGWQGWEGCVTGQRTWRSRSGKALRTDNSVATAEWSWINNMENRGEWSGADIKLVEFEVSGVSGGQRILVSSIGVCS